MSKILRVLASAFFQIKPLVCLVAGTVVLLHTIFSFTTLYLASKWPVVDGVVESFESHPAKKNSLFAVQVNYKYDVGGKAYHGTQSTFDDKPSDPGFGLDLSQYFRLEIKDTLKGEYLPGSHHEIFYDQKDPTRSFIDTKFSAFNLQTGGGFVVGILFILLGLRLLKH